MKQTAGHVLGFLTARIACDHPGASAAVQHSSRHIASRIVTNYSEKRLVLPTAAQSSLTLWIVNVHFSTSHKLTVCLSVMERASIGRCMFESQTHRSSDLLLTCILVISKILYLYQRCLDPFLFIFRDIIACLTSEAITKLRGLKIDKHDSHLGRRHRRRSQVQTSP